MLQKVDDYLIIATSSEGTVRNGSGDTIKMELMDILKGEYVNPHVSIFWYKLDSVDEVSNPDMWTKAQPNIGKTVSYETYQLDVERAERKHLLLVMIYWLKGLASQWRIYLLLLHMKKPYLIANVIFGKCLVLYGSGSFSWRRFLFIYIFISYVKRFVRHKDTKLYYFSYSYETSCRYAVKV